MLPMRLFRNRSFSAGSGSMFLLSCCLFGAVFFMAQFLQVTLHQGPLDSGLKLLPWTATLFVVAPIAGLGSWTGSASGRWWSPGSASRPRAWPGSRSSPGPACPTAS